MFAKESRDYLELSKEERNFLSLESKKRSGTIIDISKPLVSGRSKDLTPEQNDLAERCFSLFPNNEIPLELYNDLPVISYVYSHFQKEFLLKTGITEDVIQNWPKKENSNNSLLIASIIEWFGTGYHATYIFKEFDLSESVPDYLIIGKNSDGLTACFVELEAIECTAPFFTKEGYPCGPIEKGRRQISDWKAFLNRHPNYLDEKLKKFQGEFSAPIGSSANYWFVNTVFVEIVGRQADFASGGTNLVGRKRNCLSQFKNEN